MAQGTVVFFDQWLVDVCEIKMDHESGTFYMALVNTTSVPVITTTVPHWNGTGTTNLQANEVAPATGNYAANGKSLDNPSVTLTGALAEIDWDDPATWSSHVNNPTDAYWGVMYNNQTNKECVGFVDLGGLFDMTTGDLSIVFAAPVATLNQA